MPRTKSRTLLVALLALLTLPLAAAAQEPYECDHLVFDDASLAAALAAAGTGESICLEPGFYAPFAVNKSVKIRGPFCPVVGDGYCALLSPAPPGEGTSANSAWIVLTDLEERVSLLEDELGLNQPHEPLAAASAISAVSEPIDPEILALVPFDPRPCAGSSRDENDSTTEAIITGAIDISASGVEICGLTIANSSDDLVETEIPLSDLLIRFNIIHGTTNNDGVKLYGCTDCVIEYNHIFDIDDEGITIKGAPGKESVRNIVRGNEVHDIRTSNAAIYLYGPAGGHQVLDNLVYNVPNNDGIKITPSDDCGGNKMTNGPLEPNIIEGNTLHDIGQDCITVRTSNTIVHMNLLYLCGSGGANDAALTVRCKDVENVDIIGNHLECNGNAGICIGKWHGGGSGYHPSGSVSDIGYPVNVPRVATITISENTLNNGDCSRVDEPTGFSPSHMEFVFFGNEAQSALEMFGLDINNVPLGNYWGPLSSNVVGPSPGQLLVAPVEGFIYPNSVSSGDLSEIEFAYGTTSVGVGVEGVPEYSLPEPAWPDEPDDSCIPAEVDCIPNPLDPAPPGEGDGVNSERIYTSKCIESMTLTNSQNQSQTYTEADFDGSSTTFNIGGEIGVFHVSCSQCLRVGDRSGTLTITALDGHGSLQDKCDAEVPIGVDLDQCILQLVLADKEPGKFPTIGGTFGPNDLDHFDDETVFTFYGYEVGKENEAQKERDGKFKTDCSTCLRVGDTDGDLIITDLTPGPLMEAACN